MFGSSGESLNKGVRYITVCNIELKIVRKISFGSSAEFGRGEPIPGETFLPTQF